MSESDILPQALQPCKINWCKGWSFVYTRFPHQVIKLKGRCNSYWKVTEEKTWFTNIFASMCKCIYLLNLGLVTVTRRCEQLFNFKLKSPSNTLMFATFDSERIQGMQGYMVLHSLFVFVYGRSYVPYSTRKPVSCLWQ